MTNVYAGVNSLVLTEQLNIPAYESSVKKFGTHSYSPAATSSKQGSLQRQAFRYNRSDASTLAYRTTGTFANPLGPQYAVDCWFYLNSSNGGGNTSNKGAIWSILSEADSNGSGRYIRLRVTSDSTLDIELMRGLTTVETIQSIHSGGLGETNFLGAWWWIAFQRDGTTFNAWMGKSGTATQVVNNYSGSNFTYTRKTNDWYRIGGDGVGSSNFGFSPPDGYIDEFAVRYGTPFSGTVSCPTGEYTGEEEGMLDLFHFNNTADNSSGAVNFGDGPTDGDFTLFLQTFDPTSTASGFLGVPPALKVGTVTTTEEDNVNYPINPGTNVMTSFLGNAAIVQDIAISVSGFSTTTSLASVGAGLGLLVPVTGLSATASLGDIKIPLVWSEIPTGTTTTWTEIDTGDTT